MSKPSTLLNNELRKVQNYNNSIVGSFSTTGNVLTLSNISSTSIDGLPVISLNSLTNSQLNLGRVTVLPEGSRVIGC